MNMQQLTENDKIKTIGCRKVTYEDFEKLVNMGKNVMKEIADMEKQTNTCSKKLIEQTEKEETINALKDKDITQMQLYKFYIQKETELETYKKAYKVLMEEGVDQLLCSIKARPENSKFNFYELCLEN